MPDLKTAALLLLMTLSLSAQSQDGEQRGLEIALAAKAYDHGFTDFTANMIMTLKNRAGATSTRFIRIRTLEVEGDGDTRRRGASPDQLEIETQIERMAIVGNGR